MSFDTRSALVRGSLLRTRGSALCLRPLFLPPIPRRAVVVARVAGWVILLLGWVVLLLRRVVLLLRILPRIVVALIVIGVGAARQAQGEGDRHHGAGDHAADHELPPRCGLRYCAALLQA